jgi:hypothetical protein
MKTKIAVLVFFSCLQSCVLPANAGEEAVPLISGGLSVVTRKKPPQPLPPYEPNGLRIEYKVILSSAIQNAVNTYDPDFVLWEQSDYRVENIRAYPFSLQSTPSVVIGDFNDDGKIDAVLAGRNTQGYPVLAVLSSNTALYRVIPIQEGGQLDWFKENGKPIPKIAYNILSFQPKGKIYEYGELDGTITLQTDGIKNESLYPYQQTRYGRTLFWWDMQKKEFLKQDF